MTRRMQVPYLPIHLGWRGLVSHTRLVSSTQSAIQNGSASSPDPQSRPIHPKYDLFPSPKLITTHEDLVRRRALYQSQVLPSRLNNVSANYKPLSGCLTSSAAKEAWTSTSVTHTCRVHAHLCPTARRYAVPVAASALAQADAHALGHSVIALLTRPHLRFTLHPQNLFRRPSSRFRFLSPCVASPLLAAMYSMQGRPAIPCIL